MKIFVIFLVILSLNVLAFSKSHLKKTNLLKEKDVLCHTPYPVLIISRSTQYYLGRGTTLYKNFGSKVLLNYAYDQWGLCAFGDAGTIFNLEANKFFSWKLKSDNSDAFFLADGEADLNQQWGFDFDIDTKFYTIWNNACNNCYLTADTVTRQLSLKPLTFKNDPEQQWTIFVQKN